jgi:hypothetical protein
MGYPMHSQKIHHSICVSLLFANAISTHFLWMYSLKQLYYTSHTALKAAKATLCDQAATQQAASQPSLTGTLAKSICILAICKQKQQ